MKQKEEAEHCDTPRCTICAGDKVFELMNAYRGKIVFGVGFKHWRALLTGFGSDFVSENLLLIDWVTGTYAFVAVDDGETPRVLGNFAQLGLLDLIECTQLTT
jgi:hypothetical protein